MNLSGEHGDEYTILFLGSSLISVEIDGRMIGIAIVVRRGLASPVCVLLSCDQESKQRSPAQSPRWLVPWTAVRSSRARAPGCEESPHPPSSSAGKALRPVRDAMCLSRGPDQHPLGGDTAALPVAAPAQKHTGAGSSPGLYHVDNGQRLIATKTFHRLHIH